MPLGHSQGVLRPLAIRVYDFGSWVGAIALLVAFCGLVINACALLGYAVWLVSDPGSANEATAGPVLIQPLLPGVNLPFAQIPSFLLALAVSLVVHEAGHALAAWASRIKVIKFGIALRYKVLPAAFTVVDDIVLDADPRALPLRVRLRILLGGVFHNIAFVCIVKLAVVALINYTTAFSSSSNVAASGSVSSSPPVTAFVTSASPSSVVPSVAATNLVNDGAARASTIASSVPPLSRPPSHRLSGSAPTPTAAGRGTSSPSAPSTNGGSSFLLTPSPRLSAPTPTPPAPSTTLGSGRTPEHRSSDSDYRTAEGSRLSVEAPQMSNLRSVVYALGLRFASDCMSTSALVGLFNCLPFTSSDGEAVVAVVVSSVMHALHPSSLEVASQPAFVMSTSQTDSSIHSSMPTAASAAGMKERSVAAVSGPSRDGDGRRERRDSALGGGDSSAAAGATTLEEAEDAALDAHVAQVGRCLEVSSRASWWLLGANLCGSLAVIGLRSWYV